MMRSGSWSSHIMANTWLPLLRINHQLYGRYVNQTMDIALASKD